MTDTLNGRAAANIRGELARRRITHEMFAQQIPMSRPALTQMLGGRSGITLDKLERIASLLDVEPSKLLSD